MTKHDLICAKPFLISSFGMLYYAGYTFGSLFLPTLSDKKGRKNFYMGAIIMYCLSAILMNILPYGYVYPVIALFFTIGMSSSVRSPIQIVMMFDMTP